MSSSIAAISATLICTIVFGIVFLSSLLGRSWRLLSPVDRLLGSLGFLFGPPGALLAASWNLLGRSWGGSWSLLGRLGGDPKQHKNNTPKKTDFEPNMGPTVLVFWPPKEDPKSTKIGPETSQNLRRFSTAKKLVFKSLLEPSWADLGAFWRPSWL